MRMGIATLCGSWQHCFYTNSKLNKSYSCQDLAAPISLSATQSSCKLKSKTQKQQMALLLMQKMPETCTSPMKMFDIPQSRGPGTLTFSSV